MIYQVDFDSAGIVYYFFSEFLKIDHIHFIEASELFFKKSLSFIGNRFIKAFLILFDFFL